jgi:hypothetical protein
MSSKDLASFDETQYQSLIEKLLKIQHDLCFVCQEPIDLSLHKTNVDHIIPLASVCL